MYGWQDSCGCTYSLVLRLLQVDPDTYDMLKTLNMANLPGVEKVTVSTT